MELQAERTDGTHVLRVSGDIDLTVAEDVAELGLRLLAALGCRTLVIDFADVTFLGSSGISALVRIRNQAVASRQDVDLRNLSPRIARVLTITGLDSVFHLP